MNHTATVFPPEATKPGRSLDIATPRLLPANRLEHLLPGLVTGFSTALAPLGDEALAPAVRGLLARRLGQGPDSVPLPTLLKQTHSTAILALSDAPGGAALPLRPAPVYDGFTAIGTRQGIAAIKTADCVPLLAVDAEIEAYGALHVGWRGAAAGILPKLLGGWRQAGSSLSRTVLVLGPHIQACCYRVRADCLERFSPRDLDGAIVRRGKAPHLDLGTVLRTQAARFGISGQRLLRWHQCTYCHRGREGSFPYASYRRARQEGSAEVGTNVALIGFVEAG